MQLYIKVIDGNCVNHPAYINNLIQAFGKIPNDWEPFQRTEPVLGEYEVLVSTKPTYQKIGDVWMDVWNIRQMTDDERAQRDRITLPAILDQD